MLGARKLEGRGLDNAENSCYFVRNWRDMISPFRRVSPKTGAHHNKYLRLYVTVASLETTEEYAVIHYSVSKVSTHSVRAESR